MRNRLITESYLSIIGDNLAKQMGTVGENKRSDLMGLLMMISPPGYRQRGAPTWFQLP